MTNTERKLTADTSHRKSSLPEDPMWLRWQEEAPRIYDRIYYQGNPLVTAINNAGHTIMERPFAGRAFGRVLEVGAGSGQHLQFVRHGFDEYVVSDISASLLDAARKRIGPRPGVSFDLADATALPYADASFDRLVSVYNLEHLPEPHLVLREWQRVVKPGGIVSIAVPTEGHLAWNLGRYLTTRRSFAKLGLDLDYIIAREHINACYRLVALIRHAFADRSERWYPFMIPVPSINLIFVTNARVGG